MSNTSIAGSHQVSISHDPLEEHTSAGLDEMHARRDNWPSGGVPYRGRTSSKGSSLQDLMPPMDASSLRPALLAGAIGLFAAWVVSGMSQPRESGRLRQRGGRGRDWTSGGPYRNESQRFGEAQPRFSTGPEGPSSPADLSLDAMNP